MEGRIDPSKVPDLCRKHGVTPVRGEWFSKNEDNRVACACGITAVEAMGTPERLDDFISVEMHSASRKHEWPFYGSIMFEATGRTPLYCRGLSDGWEGGGEDSTDQDYKNGVEDGRAAWDACTLAGLVEDDD